MKVFKMQSKRIQQMKCWIYIQKKNKKEIYKNVPTGDPQEQTIIQKSTNFSQPVFFPETKLKIKTMCTTYTSDIIKGNIKPTGNTTIKLIQNLEEIFTGEKICSLSENWLR